MLRDGVVCESRMTDCVPRGDVQVIRRRQLCRFFFFSSRRRHTRLQGDWSSAVCSSDLMGSPCFSGGYLIRALTRPLAESVKLYPPEKHGEPMQNAGLYIGWLERFLLLKIGRASCRERV